MATFSNFDQGGSPVPHYSQHHAAASLSDLHHCDSRSQKDLSKPDLSYPTFFLANIADDRHDSMNAALRSDVEAAGHAVAATHRRRVAIIMALSLIGLLFSVMDTTIVSTALVTISEDLHDFRNVYWVVLAYLLSYIGFSVGFAKLADHFGRRPMVVTAWVIFTGFSIGCSFSTTMAELILFRALQGVGGSGLYSLCQIVLAEVAPPGRNDLVSMLIGFTLALSFILGPILGGVLSKYAQWHWIFLINIPFGVLTTVALFILWPPGFGKPRHNWRDVWKIDFVGNTLLVVASILLVYSLQQGGSMSVMWWSLTFILAFSISATCWILFWCWQITLRFKLQHIEPVFPIRLVFRRVYFSALCAMFLTGYSYMALIITLPERYQIVNGDSSLMAGVHLLPLLGATAVGSIFGGAISKKRNNTSFTLIVALSLQVLGIGLLTTFNQQSTPLQPQYGYQAIFGFGVGMTFSSATVLTKIEAAGDDHAVAQGAMAQARALGGTIGLVVCTIVFNYNVKQNLLAWLDQGELDALYHSPLAVLRFPPYQQQEVKEVYTQAFTDMVRIMLYVACAGLLAALFTFRQSPTPVERGDFMGGTSIQAQTGHRKAVASHGGSDTELDDFASVVSLNNVPTTSHLDETPPSNPNTPRLATSTYPNGGPRGRPMQLAPPHAI